MGNTESAVHRRNHQLSQGLSVIRRILWHEAARERRGQVLARLVGWQLAKRTLKRPVTISAFDSARIRCWPDSVLSSAMIYHGIPDWNEMHFLKRVLRPGDGFLDIGANIGVYSVLASTLVMPGGRVLAFEPEPRQFERLLQNFELNGLPAAWAHNVAIGEATGTVGFYSGRDAVGGVETERKPGDIQVPVRRLDELVSGSVAVAKMDIEGYELAALRGAKQLLERGGPPCWLIETNEAGSRYGTSRAELHALMRQHSYEFYTIEKSGTVLRRIDSGGPYPANALAARDTEWLRQRARDIQIVTASQ